VQFASAASSMARARPVEMREPAGTRVTSVAPQLGQDTLRARRWAAKARPSLNQPSKACPWVQESLKTIMAATDSPENGTLARPAPHPDGAEPAGFPLEGGNPGK
jgi:hypothetical protein